MFRVVPDQLRISEGWVRCGHCTEVFDATSHMADQIPPEVREAMPTQPGDLHETRPTEPDGWPTQPADWDFSLPPVPPPPPAPHRPLPGRIPPPAPEAAVAPAVVVAESPGAEIELEPSPLDAPFVFRRSDLDHGDPVPSVSPPLAPREWDSRPADLLEPEPDIDQVSFVRQARRRAFWRRPAMRVCLTLVILALACALLLQWAYQDRDRIAASQPALQPWLERMCEFMHCQLGPARQIEAIVIESSSFNKLRSDAYRLSFTLRNTGPVDVATPAMELTLTDAQDQPVLRRVLTPAELGAAGPVIAAASDWSGTVGLTVATGGTARVAGYRLLAFYP